MFRQAIDQVSKQILIRDRTDNFTGGKWIAPVERRALGAAHANRAMSRAMTGLMMAGTVLILTTTARAESGVGVPDKSFPESVTSTADGTLYVGSFNTGGVTKVAPGKPETLVKPGANGSRSTLGVLADEKSGTLFVCSNDITGFGVPGPGHTKGAWLKTFNLASGEPKGSFAIGGAKSLCNDIVVGSDGTAYVTDSFTPTVYSLKPGASSVEAWATNPKLGPDGKDGVGLDGIAIGADGNIYVTTFIPAKLFKIAVKDGKAGDVSELKPSRALDHADALRAFGDGFLLVEGAGRLDKVTIKGDEAQIATIQDGLAEPVSVTVVGNTGWVAEGKLSYIIGENKGRDPGAFTLKPVSLAK